MNSGIQESVAAGRTIEAFGLGDRRVARTDRDVEEWIAIERATLRLRTVFFPVTEAAYVIPLVLTVFIGGLLHIDGTLSVGAVTTAALYAQLLVEPVDVVLSWLDELQLGGASLARLLGVARGRAGRDDRGRAPSAATSSRTGSATPTGAGREVLRGIDLRLGQGDRLAVVGPSGAGKARWRCCSPGSSRADGRAGHRRRGSTPTGSRPPACDREIALVTQEHHVFDATVRDNLSLVAPDADAPS